MYGQAGFVVKSVSRPAAAATGNSRPFQLYRPALPPPLLLTQMLLLTPC
jgi:hypothetical protein